MKIAMFKNVVHGFETIVGENLEGCEDYIRISEYVDVEFTELGRQEVVEKEIAILKDVQKSIRVEYKSKLAHIDQKIGELLALPSPSTGSES